MRAVAAKCRRSREKARMGSDGGVICTHKHTIPSSNTHIPCIVAGLTDRVDLLLNISAILGDGRTTPGPERSLASIDRDWLQKSLGVNLIGHVMVTQAFLPLLKGRRSSSLSKVMNMSARVGSIGDNRLGGWYSYRMSKAALNQFTKTASLELKRHRCAVISMHPGTTNTPLSKPFQKNVAPQKLFPAWYSVYCMLNVLWSVCEDDTGKFFSYNCEEIEW